MDGGDGNEYIIVVANRYGFKKMSTALPIVARMNGHKADGPTSLDVMIALKKAENEDGTAFSEKIFIAGETALEELLNAEDPVYFIRTATEAGSNDIRERSKVLRAELEAHREAQAKRTLSDILAIKPTLDMPEEPKY